MKYLFLLIFLPITVILAAQETYFQQNVDVQIECSLNDENHSLKGYVTMQYTNNSPDELKEIYMHLWPNAYKDRTTAFTQQKLRTNNTDFYFAKEVDRGNLSELEFRVDGKKVVWDYTKDFIDIALLSLESPIAPGQTVEITTPFLLDIPKSYSRLGHVGESYQMTQWYPKPAVYDRNGWHPMPYYDIGEFYSEFGDCTVQITLPENYIVAATGEVQEAKEIAFLVDQVKKTKESLTNDLDSRDVDFPPSSNTMKTITFKAKNVHDFGWFADKRFHVMKSSVTLSNNDDIDTWTFFPNHQVEMWKNAINYVDRSVKFYSDNVGNYPYPQATAVLSALGAGGGMEYPMITVIGSMGDPKSLDNVITHEVGHNWFYGILAFNERDHVWMDEGINSYFDHRYMNDNYGDHTMFPIPNILKGNSKLKAEYYLLQSTMRRNEDQAPSSASHEFNSEVNYFLGGYEKPAQSIFHLEEYLGRDVFDPIMKSFYEKWKFKHPQPEDFRNHFETLSKKELSWFFDGLIGSNQNIDYKLAKVDKKKNTVTIKNCGQINAPIPIGVKIGDREETQWLEGFGNKKTIQLEGSEVSKIQIDPKLSTLEVNRMNNQWSSERALGKLEPFRLQLLSRLENPEENQIFLTPTLGWNDYDKMMLGIGVHNYGAIQKTIEYAILPMYSFASDQFSGIGTIRAHWRSSSVLFKEMTLGLNARKFSYKNTEIFDVNSNLAYIRINPFIQFRLPTKAGNSRKSNITLEYIHNSIDENSVDVVRQEVSKISLESALYRLNYDWQDKNAITPKKLDLSLEYQNSGHQFLDNEALKLSAVFNHKYQFKKKRFFEMRYFGAYYIMNDRRESQVSNNAIYSGSNISLVSQSTSDYAFDDFYFGRSAQRGLFSRQISNNFGGFKTPINQQPNSNSRIGLSNNYAFSINLRSDFPFKMPVLLPLKVFGDFGYFDQEELIEGASVEPFMWSAGLMLSYAGGRFEVYLPLLNSKEIEDAFDQIGGGYFNRVSFSLDINRMNITEERNELF